MGQERFRIRPPRQKVLVDPLTWTSTVSYDTDGFPRWRTELFAQVEVSRLVVFLQPLLPRGIASHTFDHLGLTACCGCGWEEREFLSETAARLAWWEHAEPLIDWDAVEAELTLRALSR